MGAPSEPRERSSGGATFAEGGAWWWWRCAAAGCGGRGTGLPAVHALGLRGRGGRGRAAESAEAEAGGAVWGGQRCARWAPGAQGRRPQRPDAWAHGPGRAQSAQPPPRDRGSRSGSGAHGTRMPGDQGLRATSSTARERGARRGAAVPLERYAILVALAALLPSAAGGHQKAPGGHYKAATLSWERVGDAGSKVVDITLRTAWSTEFTPFKEQAAGGVVQVGQVLRILGLGNPVLYFGDGEQSYEMVNTRVVAVDPVMKVWRGEAVVRHAYAAVGNYTAHFGGCCRDPNVLNSRNSYFNVSTSVNINATRSPYFAVLPRQYLRANLLDEEANSFIVAAYESTLHPNQLAAGRLTARPFSWSFVSVVAAESPMMSQDVE